MRRVLTRPERPFLFVYNRRADTEGDLAEALGGEPFEDERLEHLSPARFDHVNRYGKYRFDIEEESRRTGLRPLREV